MNPVLCAAFAGDAKILRALLENRADANQKLYGLSDLGFYDGQTVLMAATKSRQTPEVLSTLIELRADVNAATRIGLTTIALVRDPGQLGVLMEARLVPRPSRPCWRQDAIPISRRTALDMAHCMLYAYRHATVEGLST